MSSTLYFGTVEKMQEVKCALSGLPISQTGYSSVTVLRNGGANVVRSLGVHAEFDLSWAGRMSEVGVFDDYASGLYGTGLIYFTLPSAERSNLFAKNWAAPKLIEMEASGWPEIYDAVGVASATAANSYSQPTLSRTYTTLATVPVKRFTIPVPADMTLWLGWSGSQTASGQVYYRILNTDGTYDTPVALTAIAPTSATRLNASVAGSTGMAAEIYLYGAGTVTVASLMAQLWPTGVTPLATGPFQPGRGYSGFEFETAPQIELVQDTEFPTQYEVYNMSATLIETGQWQ